MLKRLLHHQSLEGPLEAVEAPVFVVGAVRTGTTYLTQLLNGHPHLVLGTEDNQRMRSRRTRELFEVHGTSASPVRSVGKWEKELTDEERAIAEKIMGELLEELARIMQEI